MAENALLLGTRERLALRAFLAGKERPLQIPPLEWSHYQLGLARSIPFGHLGAIVDTISPAVLDRLMWPTLPTDARQRVAELEEGREGDASSVRS